MARAKMKAKDLQRLVEERDKLLAQMDAIKHKIEGLELAMSVLEQHDEDADQPAKQRGPRGKTKGLVLSLLKEAGTTGLNAASAVELATRRNLVLPRGTAASTLSRLKADGVAVHDGDKYRLVEFTRPRVVGVPPAVTATIIGGAGLKSSQG